MEKSAPPKPDVAQTPQAEIPGHGRHAEKPSDLPKRGWFDVLTRTKRELSEDHLSIVAAGVGFYAFLAVIPALGALVATYGLVADPTQIGAQIQALAKMLPHEILPLIEEQMKRLISNVQAASVSAILGLLLAIWSSASATKALITGLNIAYGEREKRGFVKRNLMALALTFAAIVATVFMVALLAVLPAVLKYVGVTNNVEQLASWGRWPVLVGLYMIGLACIYRFGPSREKAQWRWVSWGAVIATVLWLSVSAGFSFYVSQFGHYGKTYGSLGAVVVFLLWLYLSAYVVLVGAELNSELERQTVRDTTDGTPVPLGQRGATAADTVGPTRELMA